LDNRFLLIILGIVFLISAFLISFLPNSSIFLALKIFIIITAFVLLYVYQNKLNFDPENLSASEEDDEISELDFSTITDDPVQIDSDRDVEKIFDSFLSTIIPLIKTTLFAESVVLLMVNFSKKKFYIRYKVTDHEDRFLPGDFINLDQGLPSIVFKNKNSLVENHLPDTENLLPYYSAKSQPARSFLGIPVYYKQQIVGVMCADSSEEEAFSNDELKIMTRFCQLLKIQLVSSNKLYEYETENWITKTLYDFSKEILRFQATDELWKFLGEFLKKVFGADRIIISERVNEVKSRISYINRSTPAIRIGQAFPLNEGIVGWVFRKNQSLMVEDFAEKENYVPRFLMQESPEPQYRSFLSVPISGIGTVRAAISLESFKSNKFKEQSKKILETIAYQISSFLEKMEVIEKLNRQNIFDEGTGIGNIKALQGELDREMKRSREFNKIFSMAMFRISFHQKEDSVDWINNKLISEFLTFALPLFPSSSNFFRVSESTVAIIIAEKSLQDILPVTHSICEKVDLKKVWADGMVEDFYVNCGLVQFPQMGDDSSELLEKAHKAVTKAETRGHNISAIYESSAELP